MMPGFRIVLNASRCRRSQVVFDRKISTTSIAASSRRVQLSFSEYVTGKQESLSPLLVTHGLLGSKQNWNSIAKAVSKSTNRKVVTFDARNHGDSTHSDQLDYEVMVEDTLGLAEELGIEKFVFVGHSMGGRTAASTALKYPDRLSGSVVVDISPLSVGGDFDQMKLYLESMKAITFEPSMTLSEARKMADSSLESIVPSADVRAFLLTNLTKGDNGIEWKPNLGVLLKNLHQIKRFPSDLLSYKTSVPTLFIRGEKSGYVPDSDFEAIRRLFPNVDFVTIPNAGHWPHADSPAIFTQTLVTFLKKIP